MFHMAMTMGQNPPLVNPDGWAKWCQVTTPRAGLDAWSHETWELLGKPSSECGFSPLVFGVKCNKQHAFSILIQQSCSWFTVTHTYIYIYIYIYLSILYNVKLPTSFNLLLSKNTENVHKFHFAINVFGAPDRMMRVKSVWLCTRRGAASTMSLCEGTGESSSLDIGRHVAPKNCMLGRI